MGWGSNNEDVVLRVQEPGKSTVMVLAEMVPGDSLFWVLIIAFFLFPHMVQREREAEREKPVPRGR